MIRHVIEIHYKKFTVLLTLYMLHLMLALHPTYICKMLYGISLNPLHIVGMASSFVSVKSASYLLADINKATFTVEHALQM